MDYQTLDLDNQIVDRFKIDYEQNSYVYFEVSLFQTRLIVTFLT